MKKIGFTSNLNSCVFARCILNCAPIRTLKDCFYELNRRSIKRNEDCIISQSEQQLIQGVNILKITQLLALCFLIVVSWTISHVGSHDANAEKADKKTETSKKQSTKKDSKAKKPIISKFMRKKMNASNKILEGLVVNRLDLVTEGSTVLLSMSEEEKWRASTNIIYLQHSEEFKRSVKKMNKKAKEGSLDGASLAWIDVTMSCIECHEWVRSSLIAENLDEKELTIIKQHH